MEPTTTPAPISQPVMDVVPPSTPAPTPAATPAPTEVVVPVQAAPVEVDAPTSQTPARQAVTQPQPNTPPAKSAAPTMPQHASGSFGSKLPIVVAVVVCAALVGVAVLAFTQGK